ncbi:hypothetical protein [Sphingomonas sp. BE137]|uniref:hypothetical protein n=1 Tax=Sphingomonas sp. BE137 TaxID=2817844 RepID=UPI001AE2C2AC|nr:hypothetical protein [Sphingomonas sp. BE137]MDR6850365.1 hypothetical protein [Sphingomonas sp. BE137]
MAMVLAALPQGAARPVSEATIDRVSELDGIYLFDVRKYPTAVQEQLVAIEAENGICRGHSGDDPTTIAACDRRDAMIAEVNKKGWCWGPDEAIEADRHWMRAGTACHI